MVPAVLINCAGPEPEKRHSSLNSAPKTDTTAQDSPIWAYDPETEVPVRVRKTGQNTFSPEQLIELINRHSGKGKVVLNFEKISNDTIYVFIKESAYLTQQMGTTGADAYMAEAVCTLTELKTISCVTFDFEEGDHARPGTYSRREFTERRNTAEEIPAMTEKH